MQRRILCPKCGPAQKLLDVQDREMGFTGRSIRISTITPQGHGITVNGVFEPMEVLRCDSCGEEMPNGTIAHARTIWNKNREGTPGYWEKDFGAPLTEDAVKVAETLSKPED